ncbi:MAG: TonB-dependent receptor [Oxalobacteraceae bacterium]|nr:MAG: TonB-dependent receptor [Oxalobacteraceae bacterium]
MHISATVRSRRSGRLLLAAGTSLFALLATPAFAQAEVPENADEAEIVVSGSAFQNQAEIEARRETTAIVDTLSRDEIGALPDITIAESLRRITGVTTIYNDDIGQFASIRGTHPDFLPVTLNGLTIATTGDLGEGTRKVNLQVVPGEAVQQLRAYKTLSPDLDAAALGGLIDIVTASAFDPDRSLLSVTAGASYTSYMDVPDDNSAGDAKDSHFGPSLSAIFAPRFGADESWGMVISGMYEVRPRTQSNDAITNRLYFTEAGVATNPEADNWNGFGAPNSFVSHNYTNLFTKYGGTARLEYHPSENFQSSLFGFAYFSDEQETRNTNRVYNLDQVQDQTENTGTMRVRAADTQWRYNTFERNQWGAQWLNEIALGDRSHLSVNAGYSNAWFRSNRPFVAFVYTPNTRLSYDLTNKDQPFVVDNGDAYLDASKYKIGTLYDDSRVAEEDLYEARADYGYNNRKDDRGPGLALGVSYRDLDLQRDNTATYYKAGTVTMEGLSFIPDFATPGYSHPALWLDQEKFWSEVVPEMPVDAAASDRESRINDYTYREKVLAAYVNANFTSDTFRIDLGGRLDKVDFTANMAQVLNGTLQPDQIEYEGGETNFLPYLTMNYSISDSLRLKAAASQTLGRPNPEMIATVEQVDETEFQITRGNPSIKPRKATNLDLGAELFFNGGEGMFTVTGFFKDISDDILTITTTEMIDGNEWEVSQSINGESTTYKGIEVGLINNSFGNVHPLLDRLGASANVLWVKGETGFIYKDERRVRDQLQFQADFAANAAVFVDLGGGSEVRLAMNHQGRYLEEFAANPWQEIYIDPFTTFDLTTRVNVTPQLQVRLEGRNIFSANRARSTGPNQEYFRAGLEVGSSWFLRANYRF